MFTLAIARHCLVSALLGLACSLPAQAHEQTTESPSEAVAPSVIAPQSTDADPRISRKKRKELNNEAETKELLSMIPEHHPMRDELRQIVLQGPPAGFSARQWLELSMKVNFRTAGTKGGQNQSMQLD